MAFNEDTRVKIPAILHLGRLGYEYLSLKNAERDDRSNIFRGIFKESIHKINPENKDIDTDRLLEDLNLLLDYEDLGQSFYKRLLDSSITKLVDFKHFENNTFHVVTELPYENGEESFRPDITLLINGMPLIFIEVKKPNNKDGIMAERKRINERFAKSKFRKFINISQILVFSNNMEYDNESLVPIQGAFYATTASKEAIFHVFREEENLFIDQQLPEIEDDTENKVLKDNNLSVIKNSPEFITNKEANTPTNRLLSSLFLKERVAFLLKYGIAYVKKESSFEKHIMRYPQFFAAKAIEKTFEKGIKKGIIWHTQGSGKTALAFFSIPFLTDYFQKKNIIAKFYFIVDRIDLMVQAQKELSSRGLTVHTVNSKEELLRDFKSKTSIHNLSGNREITVVNIQKFKDEKILSEQNYHLNTQRVYFLDEVHRSYNPQGSFLANLFASDKNAILIGLTGTPLIATDRRSKDIFGDYIHKYYYDYSIKDGYTLRLMRDDIESAYKMQLNQILNTTIVQGNITKNMVYSHKRFVEPMLDYIIKDFTETRTRFDEQGIGAMVVCDTSDQAKALHEFFEQKYTSSLSAALILHDVGEKDDRKREIEAFKDGKIDILFVFNMLLTGFDAPRLKKLYLGRVVRDHNLLQTLTRVNRPYKKFQYGFVVDFADIQKEFDATNKAYFEELQEHLGDELATYSHLFKSKEEIESEIIQIKDHLFHFEIENMEIFSRQIQEIRDKKQVLEIKKALQNAKNLHNVAKIFGHFDLLEKIDFQKLNQLYNETDRHLENLNFKENLHNADENAHLLNVALEKVFFMFHKVKEHELILADKLKDSLRKTQDAFRNNFDRQDPKYVSLLEELKRLFQKKNMEELTQEEINQNIGAFRLIYEQINELNRQNNLLKHKYKGDEKYARTHKRIVERGGITQKEADIHRAMISIKHLADDMLVENENTIENEEFFLRFMMQKTIQGFQKNGFNLQTESAKFINRCITDEYINEFKGNPIW